MQKKVNLAMLALFSCSLAMAQNEKTDQNVAQGLDENAFTFSEAQLGEDDDMSSNVTILNSTSNVYASQAGYLFVAQILLSIHCHAFLLTKHDHNLKPA